ncbi:MAG: response regulator [Terriglobales bacterium]
MPRKILLADDSVTAQNMGRRILTDAGYEVITVNNGSAALKKIAETIPDMIVLDVYMPGYGGLEVCQRLKESQATSRIPVLLTVGKLEPFKVEESRRVRADAHIVKPFDSTELLAAIIRLEDKIVPQPPAARARAARATGSEPTRRTREKSSDPAGETSSGWKKRLNIPRAPKPDIAEEAERPAASTSELHEREREQPKQAETESPEAVVANSANQETASAGEKPASLPPLENFNAEPPAAIVEPSPSIEPLPSGPDSEVRVESETSTIPAGEKDVVQEVAAAPEPPANGKASHGIQSPSEAEVTAALATLAPAVADAPQGGSEFIQQKPDSVRVNELAVPAAVLASVGAQLSGPRWIAEPVQLSDGDSHLILEAEMEKTYAAIAAANEAVATAEVITPEYVATEASSVPAITADTDSSVQISTESDKAPEAPVQEAVHEPVQEIEMEMKSSPAIAGLSSPDDASKSASPESAATEAAVAITANSRVEEPVVAELTEVRAHSEMPAAEETGATGYREIAHAAAASSGSAFVETGRTDTSSPTFEVFAGPPTSDAEGPKAEAGTTGTPPESGVAEQAKPEVATPESTVPTANAPDQGREAELAAAWQNWREIRESIANPQLTSQITDAAAAGFKEIRGTEPPPANQPETDGEASSRAAAEASTIAGIVDSVFAELKPKLMEEIARKLAQDRK